MIFLRFSPMLAVSECKNRCLIVCRFDKIVNSIIHIITLSVLLVKWRGKSERGDRDMRSK